MEIDIVLDSHLPSSELIELGRMAEKYGIRAVWNANYFDGREPMLNLSQLAGETQKIKLAPMALNGYEMHPFRIGMGLLTFNELCGGRAIAMLGGGGEAIMALGIEPDRRVLYTRECLEIVRGMCEQRPFSYKGQLFQINEYDPQWVTAPPPLLYSGSAQPQMLRMAATAADGIIMSDLSLNLAKECIDTVHSRMAETGRNADDFRFSNFKAWYVYDDKAEARHEARRWIGFRAVFRDYLTREFMGQEDFEKLLEFIPQIYAMAAKDEDSVDGLPDRLLDLCVDKLTLTGDIGDLDSIIEHLLEYKALGLTEMCIELKKHQAHGIKLLGERVLPALR